MALRSVNIAVILFLLNASAGLMVASGFAEDVGVELDPGAGDELDAVNESSQNVSTGSSIGQTLFGTIAEVAKTAQSIFSIIFIAPIMFQNLGVPSFITAFVFAPMYIYVSVDILNVLTGRFR